MSKHREQAESLVIDHFSCHPAHIEERYPGLARAVAVALQQVERDAYQYAIEVFLDNEYDEAIHILEAAGEGTK